MHRGAAGGERQGRQSVHPGAIPEQRLPRSPDGCSGLLLLRPLGQGCQDAPAPLMLLTVPY